MDISFKEREAQGMSARALQLGVREHCNAPEISPMEKVSVRWRQLDPLERNVDCPSLLGRREETTKEGFEELASGHGAVVQSLLILWAFQDVVLHVAHLIHLSAGSHTPVELVFAEVDVVLV